MRTLFLDTETFSETPLNHGLHRYAEKVEIMLVQWAWDDGPVNVVEFPYGALIQSLVDEADEIVMQNSAFDRTVLRHALGVVIPPEKIVDTMVQALAHGLPGSLDKLCGILGVSADEAKMKAGRTLIQLFCKPRPKNQKLRRATKHSHPQEWAQFVAYAGSDILAMRQVRKRLPSWNYPGNARERALWVLDQKINDRGIAVDLVFVERAVEAITAATKRLNSHTVMLTDGEVDRANRRDLMLKHILAEYGVDLPDLTKATLERRLEDESLPDPLKELLRVRLMTATTSTAKYKALLKGTSSDGRLRGTLQFCGASRTGRWAGRLFQPQNLPRTSKKWKPHVESYIEAISSGAHDLLYDADDTMEGAANAIRGALCAAPGHKLIASDLSNIEGRVLAWLAGEQWKLDAFAAGDDLYILGYSASFGVPVPEVEADEKAGGIMRLIGKVQELACLGPDTQVLTDSGVKRITSVTKEDKVWDGTQWVKHEGTVPRGLRQTIVLNGVEMTGDHLVLCGRSWREAKTVVSSADYQSQASATGLESLRLSGTSEGRRAACEGSECDALAGAKVPSKSATCGAVEAPGATSAPRKRAGNGARNGSDTRMSFPTTRTGAGFATAFRRASTGATTPTTGGTETTVAEVFSCTLPGEKTGRRFWPISRRWKGGTSRSLSWIGSMLTKATSRETFGSSRSGKTRRINGAWPISKTRSPNLRPVYDIANAGPNSRFTVVSDTGALVVHNCGYQGAVGAFSKMAAIYGLSLSEKRVLEIVRGWRKANAKIVDFWSDLEDAAVKATLSPGRRIECGKLVLQRDGAWLRVRLPSGRVLCYPSPQVSDEGKLSYMGVNQYTRKWERIRTYGGKLVENVTQATARDVIAHNMAEADARGYSILLSVHDELVTETLDSGQWTSHTLSQLLSANPPWAEGLPLAAEGWEAQRYRK